MGSTRDLDPRFAPYAEMFFQYLHDLDARFVITSTRRTYAEQEALYNRMLENKAAGRPFYTTLPPGTSQHERGLAFDVVRLNVDPHTDDILLNDVGPHWRAIGGTWGGVHDPIHFGAPRDW